MTDEKNEGKEKRFLPVSKAENFSLELDVLNRRDDVFKFFRDLLAGRKSGVTSNAEALMVYGRCKELRLPFLSTIDHMSVIQGKVCADIHIKTALALRAGSSLWWEKTKDYEPQYKYTDGTSSWVSPHKPIQFLDELRKEDPVAAKLQYCWDQESFKDASAKGMKPLWNILEVHNAPFDYVTEYTFHRTRKLANGEEKELIVKSRFGLQDSHKAKLGYSKDGSGRDPESNWGKYEERMTDVRAWDDGFKEIGADLAMGMPEIGEMAEVAGIPYSFDPATGNSSVSFDYKPSVDKDGKPLYEDTAAEDVTDEDGGDGRNDAPANAEPNAKPDIQANANPNAHSDNGAANAGKS